MDEKILKIFNRYFPIVFFFLLTLILFRPYFLKNLVPIPSDILLGHYYPWKDQVWDGRVAGYPIKNFILFDAVRQTLPWRLLAIEQMKAGHWPLWNPYILLGMPLLGNLQTSAFYPFNILFFILPKLDAWTIYLLLQPFLAGFFCYFFLRTLGCSRCASLAGGIFFGFSIIMMNHLEFGIDGHTVLWLPLGLGAINKLNETGKGRWGGVLMTAAAFALLGGYPPPVIYSLVIFGCYTLFKVRPLFSKKLFLVIVWVILAFGLTAPQILPSLELSKKVIREETQFGQISNEAYFFPWENLLMIIAPDIYGHPSTNNYFSRIYYSDNPSIGIVGFIFVIYSVFLFFKRKEVFFWWFWMILPMVLMLQTPLGMILRRVNISLFSLVTPMRMIWVVSFSLAVLAGIGIDNFLSFFQRDKKLNFWGIYLPLVLVWELLFFALVYILFTVDRPFLSISLRNLVLSALLLLIISVLISVLIRFPKFVKLFPYLVIFLSASELIRQGIKYNPFIKKDLIFPRVEIFEDFRLKSSQVRVMITHPELIPANANIPYKISMMDGYASIYDSRVGRLIKLVEAVDLPVKKLQGYPRIVFQTKYNSSLIDLFGIKYVFSLEEIKDSKLKLLEQKGKTRIYENTTAYPRMFLVNNYSVGRNDLEVANIMLKTNLTEEVVLEKSPGITNGKKGKNETSLEIVDYQEDKIQVNVDTTQDSILVIGNAYDSGWSSMIDNKDAEVLRANYDLQAVVVPAGKHEVELRYFPKSFSNGLKIFILSLVIFLAVIIFVFVRKVRTQTSGQDILRVRLKAESRSSRRSLSRA